MTLNMKAVALRNRINKHEGNWSFNVKNVRVNDDPRGCSGFITNEDTGRIVYVNTESSCLASLSDKVLYRTAVSTKDYQGGRNRWGLAKDNQFIEDIVALLKS